MLQDKAGRLEKAVRAGKPAKLLHIFPSFARGGQQMRLAAISAGLGDEFVHHIVSLDGDVSAGDAIPDAEVEVFKARKARGISISDVLRLTHLVRRSDAQILCTYNFGSIEAVIANKFAGRPHIHHEDGFGADETPDRQKLRRVLLRRFALRTSQTVVPSETLKNVACRTWRLPAKRVSWIPNGIDVPKFSMVRTKGSRGPLVVGSVGALRREKNYGRLIRVFTNQKQDAQLAIYGDGPIRQDLASAASSCAGRVALRGPTAKPELAYAEFDIFALSSDTEQMPLSLMEAMAAGLPVIATDVGDVKAMVSAENRDFIIAPSDEASLSAALGRLLADPTLRARIGAANAEKAQRTFGVTKMIAAHGELYRQALDRISSR